MNPRAGLECKNFATVPFTSYGYSLSPDRGAFEVTCLLRSVYSPGTRNEDIRMDAEAMVGGSFPSCWDTVSAKIDAEIRILCFAAATRLL